MQGEHLWRCWGPGRATCATHLQGNTYGAIVDLVRQHVLPICMGNTNNTVNDLVKQHVPPTCRGNTDDAIVDLVRQHVPASSLSTRGGTELAFKLPRDDSSSFATLLSQLEGRKAELGVLSCGLSVTTLEEVFLKVSAGSGAALDQKQAAALTQPQPVSQNIYNSGCLLICPLIRPLNTSSNSSAGSSTTSSPVSSTTSSSRS